MIKWITDIIGTGAFETVENSSLYVKIDVRDMVDKAGNTEDLIKEKIDSALIELNKGNKIVVCCDYGMSRSNSIAVGVIAKFLEIDFSKALKLVLEKTNEKSIKIEVLTMIRKLFTCNNKTTPESMMVTGGRGFIGQRLIPELSKKHNVLFPSSSDIDLEKDIVLLDLFVKEHNVKTIIHLANPRIYTTNQSLSSSVLMTKNILDVCISNEIKIVYLSSWEIYSGYNTLGFLASETTSAYPKGTYGLSKAICENLIRHYMDLYALQSLIVRSSTFYGVGADKPKFIYNFLNKALNDDDVSVHKYFDGLPALDFLHIDDLINFLERSIEKKLNGEYNIGTGILTSTSAIAEHIIKKTCSKSFLKHVTVEERTHNIAMDIKKANQDLQFSPKIKLEDGLSDLINNYKKGLKGEN